MRKIIFIFVVMCFLTMAVWALADEAIIVDKKDVKVELSNVETKKIYIDVDNFENLAIPVAAISSIRLAEDRKKLIIQSVTGRVVKGNSSSKLEGEWELGKYSVSLSDIKSIEFRWDVQQQETSPAVQPDGFYAVITDWTGKTMEVFDLKYLGRYWWSSPYINRSSHMIYEHRKYLPVEYKEIIVGVPFTDIDTIKFTDIESTEMEWEPTLDIKLVDGTTLVVRLARWGERAPKFTGEVLNGDLVERIHQIAFNHKRDKNAQRVIPGRNSIYKDLDSVYTISLKTSQGHQIVLRNGCLLGLNEGYRWTTLRTKFNIKLGESTTAVDFSKIKSFRFSGTPKAQMTTTSGKTVDVLLPDYNKIWIGGNFDRFGPARIKLSRVSSLEISKTTN